MKAPQQFAPAKTPAGMPPRRRPNSIRRTTSIDSTWPAGVGQPWLMIGTARDLLTCVDGSAVELASGVVEIVVSVDRQILAIELRPPVAEADALKGVRAGGASRARIAETLGQLVGTPLYQLLDDFAGASLVASWVWPLWSDDWEGSSARRRIIETAGKGGRMVDVCSGFAAGASSMLADGSMDPKAQSYVKVDDLVDPADPIGWHTLPTAVGPQARRSRRTDIWRSGDWIVVDAGFQDSGAAPDGSRSAVHEYRVHAEIDANSQTIRSLQVLPHILPFRECPVAAVRASRLIGEKVADLRDAVPGLLASTSGCTHLNDILRSFADIRCARSQAAGRLKSSGTARCGRGCSGCSDKTVKFARTIMAHATPLNDVPLVVHIADGIAAAYCTKMLVDGGARAIRVEAPGGDSLRARSASGAKIDRDLGGPLFQFLASATRSVTADPADPAQHAKAWQLIEAADIVVWSEGSPFAKLPEFAPGLIRERAPGAVVTALSSYGLWAADRPRPATEFTLQAMSGGWITRGDPNREPLAAGGEHGEWVGGTFAALGALASWMRARDLGRGELVDVSMLDALHLTQPFFAPTFEVAAGRPYRSNRGRPMPMNHPVRDGFVGFQITTGQQWLDFCVMVERPDWAEDLALARQETRTLRYDEVCGHIDAWTSERTMEEVLDFAAALRIPVAPVNDGKTIQSFDQVAARGWLVTNPVSGFRQPVPPYTFWGDAAPRAPAPSPRLGEHNGEELPAARQPAGWQTEIGEAPAGRAATGEEAMPFEGLRIIDFTAFWAGPIIAHFFAILGADVIHVESTKRPDGIRAATLRHDMSEGWWEASPFFAGTNTNKRAITLDMNSEQGRALALRLIADADVLVENFSSRVMEQWGMTYDALKKINPRLVMLRASGFGNTGPWRDHVCYATTVEQASGLSWVTGFGDERPEITGGACDPIAGSHAAYAIMLGLEHRRRTGEGILIEAPQFTTGISISAEQVIEETANGVVLARDGNRSWVHAPQGAYRVADADQPYADMARDQWIAVSVTSPEQWQALCAVIGAEDLANDPALADVRTRILRHDEIDAAIVAWARPLDAATAVTLLIENGVPASRFASMAGLHHLPEVVARGLYETVDQPVLGQVPIVGYPAQFEHGPHQVHRSPAPTLGQHNREVLEGVLGLDPSEVAALEADGVIGDRPKMAVAW